MNACCEDPTNRREGAGPRGLDAPLPKDVTVTHCIVCECRHFEATFEPGKLGLKGGSLG